MAVEVTSTLNIWLPLITGATGLVSGVVLEWYRDKRTYNRERDARGAIRRDAQIERRNEFQRQTLLDLQEAANNLIKITTAINLHIANSFYATSGFTIPRSPDLDRDALDATFQFSTLCVRVKDEQVRALAQTFQGKNLAAAFNNSPNLFENVRIEMMDLFNKLNVRIGEALCSIDEVEAA